MGLISNWQNNFLSAIHEVNPNSNFLTDHKFTIISCGKSLYIHLVPLENQYLPEQLVKLQLEFSIQNKLLVHLWEDVWLSKKNQVLGRIKSFLGLNKSIHGRKTKISPLTQEQAFSFLDLYHLQGFVKAKYYFGLLIGHEILAVAGFSAARDMVSKGTDYRSAELVRFATKDGFTVVGGLSKLIKHFIKIIHLNDLMSYADRDWSLGKGYLKLKFELGKITAPTFLYVQTETLERFFPHRIPKHLMNEFDAQKKLDIDLFLANKGYRKIFNTGNLKYHLYLND